MDLPGDAAPSSGSILGRNERLRFQIGDYTFCINRSCLLDLFYINSLGGNHLLAALADHEKDMVVSASDSGVICVDRPALYFQRYLADIIMKGASAGSLLVFQNQVSLLNSAELAALLEECEFFQLTVAMRVVQYHLHQRFDKIRSSANMHMEDDTCTTITRSKHFAGQNATALVNALVGTQVDGESPGSQPPEMQTYDRFQATNKCYVEIYLDHAQTVASIQGQLAVFASHRQDVADRALWSAIADGATVMDVERPGAVYTFHKGKITAFYKEAAPSDTAAPVALANFRVGPLGRAREGPLEGANTSTPCPTLGAGRRVGVMVDCSDGARCVRYFVDRLAVGAVFDFRKDDRFSGGLRIAVSLKSPGDVARICTDGWCPDSML